MNILARRYALRGSPRYIRDTLVDFVKDRARKAERGIHHPLALPSILIRANSATP